MGKLRLVQSQLKAPKGQTNTFGKYKYRSCEDILEAAKPLLNEAGLTLTLTDTLLHMEDRYYVQATATVYDDEGNSTSVSALAREEAEQRGMVAAQLSGSTSSYARKYALNGLLLIDDSKDADSNEQREERATRQTFGSRSI